MIIELKSINRESEDELIQEIVTNFKKNGKIEIDSNLIENKSQVITYNGKKFFIDIDMDEYMSIVNNSNDKGYTKNANLSIKLYKDLTVTAKIPRKILYDNYVWAYLSLTYFYDVVNKLKLDDKNKIDEKKIKQFLFNKGTISRTGLKFLWCMADRLKDVDNYDLIHTAFEFIDPVKAIFERTMSKNEYLLKAYVQGIINNGKDSRFKNEVYRTKVPNHISCFAAVNMLETNTEEDMINIITNHQAMVLNEV